MTGCELRGRVFCWRIKRTKEMAGVLLFFTYHSQDDPIVPGGRIAEVDAAPVRAGVAFRHVGHPERGFAAVVVQTVADVVVQRGPTLFRPFSS